jgi:hypothetical protein
VNGILMPTSNIEPPKTIQVIVDNRPESESLSGLPFVTEITGFEVLNLDEHQHMDGEFTFDRSSRTATFVTSVALVSIPGLKCFLPVTMGERIDRRAAVFVFIRCWHPEFS